MSGSTPKRHQQSIDGTDYIVETSQHEHGISIVVTLPGQAPEEENARTFATEHEALAGAEAIARDLLARDSSREAAPEPPRGR